MKMKSESEVTQSCLILSDPMDCSSPGSSIHGIFQARVLEWDAIMMVSHVLFSENVPVAIIMLMCCSDIYNLLFHLIFSLGP